jgi:hypothetical protein
MTYSQWYCAYICQHGYQCTNLLDDINTKNKKRIYCDLHRILMQKRLARERYLRWKAKKHDSNALIAEEKLASCYQSRKKNTFTSNVEAL